MAKLRRDSAWLLGLALMVLCSPSALAEADAPQVRVEGSSLQVHLPDGRVLTGAALVGAVLTISDREERRRSVRIEAAEREKFEESGAPWLYRLQLVEPDAGLSSDLCRPDANGRRLGFPLQGTTTDDGGFLPDPDRLTFACTSGALGKCIRLGYSPWRRAADGGLMLDYLRACLRMIRADYCGDGRVHTREGVEINVYDRLGIQRRDPNPNLPFEAAWGPVGAVCLGRTRLGGAQAISRLGATCLARLTGRVGPDCSRVRALSLPQALIFNDSAEAP